jgi:mono/diheme cytochrome c family protein
MPRCAHPSLAVAAFVAMALVGGNAVAQTRTDPQNFARVEKGRYLAMAADCIACHTRLDGGTPYAGGRPIETPFGNITSANITPDRDTGIGGWTDDQFDNAVRHGIRPDGSRLYPAMPYPYYTKMSRDDVLAIRAFLNTLKAGNNPVVTNTLPFPFNIRAVMHVWDWLYFKDERFKPNPQKPSEWNRGAFLVEGPGHCGACHTPKNLLGADKGSQYLRGYNLQGWFAPAITNDERTGLGRWTADDIVAFLKSGHNRIGAAVGPMAEEVMHASSGMSDDDLKAIATYLKDHPGHSDKPAPLPKENPQMVAGEAIYRDQCAACHQIDGKGVPRLFPALADSSIVRSDDPTSLLHLVLRGNRSVATKDEPTGPGMPSFAWQLNDAQIAAVATYVRNNWANPAPAVTQGEVAKQRSKLGSRSE